MNQSEFWNALEQVYGPALGRSLVYDLYLPSLQMTANEALEKHTKVDVVWNALIVETGRGEEDLWVHRRPQRKR